MNILYKGKFLIDVISKYVKKARQGMV